MKKIIFGIFAHPDDEAFGPCGTLLLETRAETELHLVTLTAGENGTNPDNDPDLGSTRLQEWHKAGELLGATSMHHFGYTDGTLSNLSMIEIAGKVENLVKEVLRNEAGDVEIEFMSLDSNGLTGHIDHIVAARAACLAFYRLKSQDEKFIRIRLFCLPNNQHKNMNTDWIYMEAGRLPEEINETIDAREIKDDIITVMKAHHTQRGDYENQIALLGNDLGLNHFIIKT
ncbi:MAG TPA: PIG-L family deacetylase [Candidatus Saccharimonadales bacterium]|nr:PIG-L family deacetylase [Candidatus Saccharimonadales bacterium]